MKVILNEKDLLEQELEQAKNIEKSKNLTNDLIEKIEKCKTNEEFSSTYNKIKPKLQDLNNEDASTLINKLFEKTNSLYKENKKEELKKGIINIQLSNNDEIEYKITCNLDGVININLKEFKYINYEKEEESIYFNYGEVEDYYDEDEEEEEYL